jgi:hypothetical protein
MALVLLISLSSSTLLNLVSSHLPWFVSEVRAESKHHNSNKNLTPSINHSMHSARIMHPHQPVHSLQICCGWNPQSTNGQLSYKVIGGTKPERQAVNSAASAWMKRINGLNLIQASKNISADIIVGFQNAADQNSGSGIGTTSRFGDTVGQTSTYFDSSGYIDHAVVTIATAAFGNNIPTSQLKQIAMHELGHSLGLGHANFNGDLMSPVINPTTGGISKCDIDGVMHAEQWLAGYDVNGTPSQSQGHHVNC